MPAGFLPLKEFDRDAWVAGATYYPDPDIAVKVDYVWQRNQSTVVNRAEQLQHRPRLVVLTEGSQVRVVIGVRCRDGAVGAGRTGAAANARRVIHDQRRALLVHAVRDQGPGGRGSRVPDEERRHLARLPPGRHQRHARVPKRGRDEISVMSRRQSPAGTFECSRMCGAGHNFMRGVVTSCRGAPGQAGKR